MIALRTVNDVNKRKAPRYRVMWLGVALLVFTVARCGGTETFYLCPIPSTPCYDLDAGEDADASPDAAP